MRATAGRLLRPLVPDSRAPSQAVFAAVAAIGALSVPSFDCFPRFLNSDHCTDTDLPSRDSVSQLQ